MPSINDLGSTQFRKTPKWSAHEQADGVRINGGPFVGIVKANTDPLRSGRLQVWIPELGGNPNDDNAWRTVNYSTPFYGVTNHRDNSGYEGAPHSYGMWFVPPDIGVKVLCTFVNGDPARGYWFACIPEWPNMHMVPGISAPVDGSSPNPVVDYYSDETPGNQLSQFTTLKKQSHSIQEKIWETQGLLQDPDRGPGTSSAFRETPSAVFGISTPGQPLDPSDPQVFSDPLNAPYDSFGVKGRKGGHTFIMDDGDSKGKNQMVRLRSAGGHMIMMNDTKDFIYVINSKGTSWVEINSQGDINVYSGSKVNVFAQSEINLETKGSLKLHGGTVDIKSDAGLNIEAKDINILGSGSTKLTGKQALHLKGMNTYLTGDSCIQIKADGHIDLKGACHTINTADATKAMEASGAQTPSSMPTKEAWTGHQSAANPQAQPTYGAQQHQPAGAAGKYGATSNYGSGTVQQSYGPMTNNIPPTVYNSGPQGSFSGQSSLFGSYSPEGYISSGLSFAVQSLIKNITYGTGASFTPNNAGNTKNTTIQYSVGESQNNPGNLQYDPSDKFAVGFANHLAVYTKPENGIAALMVLFDSYINGSNITCISLVQKYLQASSPTENNVVSMARFIQNSIGINPTDFVNLKDPTTRIGWASTVINYLQKRIIYTYDQVLSGCALSLGIDTATFAAKAQPVSQPWQNSNGGNQYSGFVNPAKNTSVSNNGSSPLQAIGTKILNSVINNIVGTVSYNVGSAVGNTINTVVNGSSSTAGSAISQNTGVFSQLNGQVFGNGQCAALAQSNIPNFGTMSSIQQGANVFDTKPPPGTIITTFNYTDANGNPAYAPPGSGGVSGSSHTAAFLDYHYDANGNRDGIVVQDQYSGKSCGPRVIYDGNGNEAASKFYVAKSAANGYDSNGVQLPGSPTTTPAPDNVPLPTPRPADLNTTDSDTTAARDITKSNSNIVPTASNPGDIAGGGTNNTSTTNVATVSNPTDRSIYNYGSGSQAQDTSITVSGSSGDRLPGDATGTTTAQIEASNNAYYASSYPSNPLPADNTSNSSGLMRPDPYIPAQVGGLTRTYDAASGTYSWVGKDDTGASVTVSDSTIKGLYASGQTTESLNEIGAGGIKSINDSGTIQASLAQTEGGSGSYLSNVTEYKAPVDNSITGEQRDAAFNSDYNSSRDIQYTPTSADYKNQMPQPTNSITSPDAATGYVNPDQPAASNGLNQGTDAYNVNSDPRQGEGTLSGGYNDPVSTTTAQPNNVQTQPTDSSYLPIEKPAPSAGSGSAAPGGAQNTPQGTAATNGAGKSC